MQNLFTGIDHPVIGVPDMDGARKIYEALGFTIPPRGVHPAWGTGNWCIMFQSDYLELRGVVEPAQGAQKMRPFFDKYGEGLMGVAIGTNDADACHAELVRRGLHPQPVRQLTRNFELPAGTVQPKFSLCFLDQKETPGLMSVVICQHLTPELLRRPEWLRHENGARGVQSMTGIVSDLSLATEIYERLLDNDAFQREGESVTLNLSPTQAIHLTTPQHLPVLHPGLDAYPHDTTSRLVVVRLLTTSLTATRDYFTRNGIEFTERQGILRVPAQQACGVVFEFED